MTYTHKTKVNKGHWRKNKRWTFKLPAVTADVGAQRNILPVHYIAPGHFWWCGSVSAGWRWPGPMASLKRTHEITAPINQKLHHNIYQEPSKTMNSPKANSHCSFPSDLSGTTSRSSIGEFLGAAHLLKTQWDPAEGPFSPGLPPLTVSQRSPTVLFFRWTN